METATEDPRIARLRARVTATQQPAAPDTSGDAPDIDPRVKRLVAASNLRAIAPNAHAPVPTAPQDATAPARVAEKPRYDHPQTFDSALTTPMISPQKDRFDTGTDVADYGGETRRSAMRGPFAAPKPSAKPVFKRGVIGSALGGLQAGLTPGRLGDEVLDETLDHTKIGHKVIDEGDAKLGVDHLGRPIKGVTVRDEDVVAGANALGDAAKEYGYMRVLGPVAARARPLAVPGMTDRAARLAESIAAKYGLDQKLADYVVAKAVGAAGGAVGGAVEGTTFMGLRAAAEGHDPDARELFGGAAAGAGFGGLAGMVGAGRVPLAQAVAHGRDVSEAASKFRPGLPEPQEPPRRTPSPEEPIAPAATHTEPATEVERLKEELRKAKDEAYTNPVSGLPNHAAFAPAVARANKDPNLGVASIDANNFKGVNDTAGHSAGNAALHDIGAALQQAAYEHDVDPRNLFHPHGDEFSVIAPHDVLPRIIARAEEIFGQRNYGGATTSISSGIGNTYDEADANLLARKALEKISRGDEPARAPTGLDGAGRAMADNMHDMLWQKVLAGDVHEGGVASPLLQVAAVARARGGVQTPEQFRSLVHDFTSARSAGGDFQSNMHALVEKYSAPPNSGHTDAIKHGDVVQLHRSQIRVLPNVMQYKTHGIGADGATNEMRDVEVWDPIKAGVLQVWRAPADETVNGEHIKAGDIVNVNGHHRLERANALGVDRPLNVQFIDAKNAAEARQVGALTNIAEGKGSAIDAAQVFRGWDIHPDDVPAFLKREGVSLKGAIARDGIALSHLAPSIFGDVAVGKMPLARGATIGSAGLTHAQQFELLKMAPEKFSTAQLAELARDIKDSGSETVHQETLFGNEATEVSLAPARAKLSAWVKEEIGKDARLFKFLSKNERASTIEGSGVGTVDTDVAKTLASKGATATELYDRLSSRAGPIGRILTDAARRVVNGERESDVRKEILPAVHDAIRGEVRPGSNGANPERVRQDRPDADTAGTAGAEEQPAPPAERPLDVGHADDETGSLFERGPVYNASEAEIAASTARGRALHADMPDLRPTPPASGEVDFPKQSEAAQELGRTLRTMAFSRAMAKDMDSFHYLNRLADEVGAGWHNDGWVKEIEGDIEKGVDPNEAIDAAMRRDDMRNSVREKSPEYAADDLQKFGDEVRDRLGLRHFYLSDSRGDIKLHQITVPRDMRRQGVGSRAMEELARYADKNNKRIILSTGTKDPAQGTTSRARLVRFYKRFGFVENRGRNTDHSVTAHMIRDPKSYDVSDERTDLFTRTVLGDGDGKGVRERAPAYGEENPFKVLGVPPTADMAQVKRAFWDLAKTHHPDKGGDLADMQRIARAYESIKADPAKWRAQPVRAAGTNETPEEATRRRQSARSRAQESPEAAAVGRADYERRVREWEARDGAARREYEAKESARYAEAERLHDLREDIIAGRAKKPAEKPSATRKRTILDRLRGVRENGPAYNATPASPWYSRVERAIEAAPFKKGTGEQWLAALARTSKAEREWVGLEGALTEKPGEVYTRDEVMDFAKDNAIKLGETVGGGEGNSNAVTRELNNAYDDENRFHVDMRSKYGPDVVYPTMLTPEELERKRAIIQRQHDAEKRLEAANKPAKFSSYTEPGGTNYREIKIQLDSPSSPTDGDVFDNWALAQGYHRSILANPETRVQLFASYQKNYRAGQDAKSSTPSQFRTAHFDEPNIVAHLRVNDRTLPNGEKVLFGEELQSDWQQKIRREGVRSKPLDPQDVTLRRDEDAWIATGPDGITIGLFPLKQSEDSVRRDAVEKVRAGMNFKSTAPPDMPFKKTEDVTALMLKRMIQEAVRGGYDRVAWTSGDHQVERYKLSKKIGAILWDQDTQRLTAWNPARDRTVIDESGVTAAKLPNYIGKDAADKIIAETPDEDGSRVLEGVDLDVGGDGMRAYYDTIVPNVLKKIAKQIGTTIDIEPTVHGVPKMGDPAQERDLAALAGTMSFRITPELREAVRSGMAVMERGPDYNLFGEPEPASHAAAKPDSEQPSLLPEHTPARGVSQADVEARQVVSFLRGKGERGAASRADKEKYQAAQALLRRNEKIGADEISRVRRDDAQPEIPTLPGQQMLFERKRPISHAQMQAQQELVFGSVEAAAKVARQTLEDAGSFAQITLPGLPTVEDRAAAVRAGRIAMVTVPATGHTIDPDNAAPDIFRLIRPFRSPDAEYLHFIVTDSHGRTDEHHMTSTGALDMALVSYADVAQAAARAKKIGGAVYMGHNHPSGNPIPSPEDMAVDRATKDVVEAAGAVYGGHLVTNHETAIFIDENGKPNMIRLPREKEHDWTDIQTPSQIKKSSDVFGLIRGLPVDADRLDVLVLNTQNNVIGFTTRPIDDIDSIGDWGVEMLRDTGGSRFVLGTSGSSALMRVSRATKAAHLSVLDVVDVKNMVSGLEIGAHKVQEIGAPTMKRVFEKGPEYGEEGDDTDRVRDSGRAGEPPSLRERRSRGGDGPTVPGTEGSGSGSEDGGHSTVPADEQIRGLLREMSAGKARAGNIAEETLLAARMHYTNGPIPAQEPIPGVHPDRWKALTPRQQAALRFIDDIEHGRASADPQVAAAARLSTQMLTQRRQAVRSLGTGKLEHFIENYFPHTWKDPDQPVIGRILGQRPLEGPKSFLKKRTIPFTIDGINAGLEPVSWNPIDMVLLKAREMDRYTFAQQMIAKAKQQGLARFFHASQGMPDGWARVNDNMFTVHGPPGEDGSTTILGYWGAPQTVANIMNTYLAPGIAGNATLPEWQRTAFRMAQRANNALNAAQLGFSAFHATAESINSVISMVALGLEETAAGNIADGMKHLALSPVAPVEQVLKGNRLLKEWAKPGTLPHDARRVINALVAGGFHARADDTFRMNAIRALHAASNGSALERAGAVRHVPGATLELFAKPIMEGLVPRLKIAAAYDLASFVLKDLAEQGVTDPAEIRKHMYEVVRSIDNRFGQLALDNLFWHRAQSDIFGLLVRSRGWTWGTISEIGGGIGDLRRLPGVAHDASLPRGNAQLASGMGDQLALGRDLDKAARRRISHRTSYAAALVMVTALMGAVLNRLLTGENPNELRDYYFPRTGKKRPDGSDDRISLPTYMKDIVAFKEHPWTTLGHKSGPLVNIVAELMQNEDYYGQEIVPRDGSLPAKAASVAEYVGRTSLPLAARGMLQMREGREGARALLPLVGLTPAPASITRSKFENYVAERTQETMPTGARTKSEVKSAQHRRDAEIAIRNHTPADLTDSQRNNVRTAAKLNVDENRFRHLGLQQQIEAYKLATPEERTKNHLRQHIWSETLQDRLDNLEPDVRKSVRAELRELRRPVTATR